MSNSTFVLDLISNIMQCHFYINKAMVLYLSKFGMDMFWRQINRYNIMLHRSFSMF